MLQPAVCMRRALMLTDCQVHAAAPRRPGATLCVHRVRQALPQRDREGRARQAHGACRVQVRRWQGEFRCEGASKSDSIAETCLRSLRGQAAAVLGCHKCHLTPLCSREVESSTALDTETQMAEARIAEGLPQPEGSAGGAAGDGEVKEVEMVAPEVKPEVCCRAPHWAGWAGPAPAS